MIIHVILGVFVEFGSLCFNNVLFESYIVWFALIHYFVDTMNNKFKGVIGCKIHFYKLFEPLPPYNDKNPPSVFLFIFLNPNKS